MYLDPDAGALVHLHVWLLRLLERPLHLRLCQLYQALQLVCHHQYIFFSKNYKARIYMKSLRLLDSWPAEREIAMDGFLALLLVSGDPGSKNFRLCTMLALVKSKTR
jgi:hypothetical protein